MLRAVSRSQGGGGGGNAPNVVNPPDGTVTNYSTLVSTYPAASYSGYYAWVVNAQGIRLINYKKAGWYYSDGSTWSEGTPYDNEADAVSYDNASSGLTATNVQTAIDELASGGGGGAVTSVNGQTGVVVLDTSDVDDSTNRRYVTDAQLVVIGNTSGTNTGDQTNITGNAGTATALQTARNINGVSFNGTADITVTAAAGTLTGTTLAANVVSSSLTSVGTLANLTVTNPITGSVSGNAATVTTNANLTGDVTSVGNATSIATGVIVDADVNASAAIAATKIGAGSVDNTEFGYLNGVTSAIQTQIDAKSAKSQIFSVTASYVGVLPDGTYRLGLKIPFGGTINETVSICGSGTATATFKINTTALGGTANSVSSSEQTQAQASANVFVTDDDINVTISASSTLTDPTFTVKYTRALA